MTDPLPIRICHGTFAELGPDAEPIRHRVFVLGQNVPPEIESDGRDPDCRHVLVMLDGLPVATGRLAPDGKVGRVAVLPEHRGQGLGRLVMQALEDEARKLGLTRVWFHAQESAIGFYERLGYRCYGEPFLEASIPHRAMERELDGDRG